MLGRCWGSIKPLHAKAETPVFVNKLCQRIKPDQFRKDQWYRALRALNIRPRDFYSCKDTAISLDRTRRRSRKKWEFLFQHSSAITASIWTRRCRKKCNRKCDGIEVESKRQ